MSSWDYDWRAGPKGGTLTALDTLCDFVRLADGNEPIGAKRGGNVVVPYRHGAIPIDHKFNQELLVYLEVGIRFTDAAGLVTDPSGEAGHVYANKQALEALFFGLKGLATLQRTLPTDTWQVDVEPVAPSQATQERWTYLYVLRAPAGFWKSTTARSETASPFTVNGNAPIDDAVIDIVGGTDVVVTMGDGSTISVEGATPAGGVRIDLAAGTVTEITGGTDYHEFVSFNRPWAIVLDPGANTFTTSGSPTSVTFQWNDKLR